MNLDIAIIGASSAGLFAAEKLAQAGLHVGVFEREKELYPSRRTYIITPYLADIFDNIPDNLILNRVSTMAVETSQAVVDIRLKQPDLIIERSQMIAVLAERAQAAGAKIHFGTLFQGFQQTENGTVLLLRGPSGMDVQVAARTVMGADGAFSQVAKTASITQPSQVPLMQAEIALPDDWHPEVTKVWFDTDETRFFYWLIPESDKQAVVGLIANERSNARQVLDRFLEKHNFQPLKYQAGQAAMHTPGLKPWGKVGNLPVLLVGDAAGHVKVTTVGGSVTGFWGAQAAVDSILNGKSYAEELRALKRELDLHWFIRLLLERLDNRGYDDLVKSINPGIQDFLGQHTRDEMAGEFWKMIFIQPRFIPLGLRLLWPF